MMAHASYESAAETAVDARSRAWRTFLQGVGLDVAVALSLVLYTATAADVQWTAAYWQALALLAAKTVVQSAVAAVHRRISPPGV